MKGRTFTALVSAAAAASLLVSACSGSGGSTDAQSGSTAVKVVLFPSLEFAPIWVAQEQGYFKDQGLDVTGDAGGAGSSAGSAALLVSGSYQLALSTIPNIVQADSQGINLKVVRFSSVIGGPQDKALQLITTSAGPDSLAKLGKGTTVGVSALKSPQSMFCSYAIDHAGGDSKQVTFQSVPTANAAQLVQQKSVTATALFEPYLTAALKNPQFKSIGSCNAELPSGTPSLAVVATADYIQKNGPTIKAFNAALDKAVVWIENPSNKDALIALAAQRTGQSADVVKAAIFPTYYSSGMKESSVQWLLNLCKQYGLVDKVSGVDVVVDPNALK